MKDQLLKNYMETEKNYIPPSQAANENRVEITFIDGPKVEVLGDEVKEYFVRFTDMAKGVPVYETTIKNGMWCSSYQKRYIKWKVEVYHNKSLIKEEVMNLQGKKVKVVLETNSLGDILAYIGAVEKFRTTHNCKLDCVVYNRHLLDLLAKSYKDITFLSIDERNSDYYAIYRIGWFKEWQGRTRKSPQQMSLANISGDILGLGILEFKPKLVFNNAKKTTNKKYVCISVHSTSQFKYWNNPSGWRDVVKYLNSLGYEVWCIDKFATFGIPGKMNTIPPGVVDMTGDYSLEDRLQQLSGAEFFIGLSSGLSWMAWSVNIPVILISGIGKQWTEFFTPHRVINEKVCNACTNDVSTWFDKSDWMYCPRNKNFECTVQISAKQVIDEIDKLQTNFYKKVMHNFDWGWYSSTPQTELLYREIFVEKLYEKFLPVEDGDVVMDIGTHVGSFSLQALTRNIKKIITVEPSPMRMETIKKNLKDYSNVVYIQKGITDKEEVIKNGLEFDHVVEDFHTTAWDKLMEAAGVSQIDFMKIDCEGGEYYVFTEDRVDWIKKNIKKIAGEWHLNSPSTKQAFRKFRDTTLKKFDNYQVYSLDGVDIKWDLFNEHFIEYYDEILMYFDNRSTFEQKEETTEIPKDKQSSPLITEPSYYTDSFKLKGKVAIVTGAGGHLGGAMSMGLSSHHSVVIALGRDVSKIKQKLHTKENYLKDFIVPMECDVTDESKFKEIVQKVIEKYGRIDVLINNAFNEKRKPFEKLEKTDWNNGMDAILTQQFTCCQAVLPYMVKQGSGSIINIASIYGSIGIDQRAYQEVPSSTVFYCAAKAGSIQLTKELAVQYADKGVRVNSISPGHFPKPPTDPSKANPRYVKGLADMVPMKRVGSADELAGAAVFLASDASSYVTGHNLVVDGGRTIW